MREWTSKIDFGPRPGQKWSRKELILSKRFNPLTMATILDVNYTVYKDMIWGRGLLMVMVYGEGAVIITKIQLHLMENIAEKFSCLLNGSNFILHYSLLWTSM